MASFIAAFTNRLLTANFETASIINFNAGESAALANSRALGRSGVINLITGKVFAILAAEDFAHDGAKFGVLGVHKVVEGEHFVLGEDETAAVVDLVFSLPFDGGGTEEGAGGLAGLDALGASGATSRVLDLIEALGKFH